MSRTPLPKKSDIDAVQDDVDTLGGQYTESTATLTAAVNDRVKMDDPRLTDDRAPLPHAADHGPGGPDDLSDTYATVEDLEQLAQGIASQWTRARATCSRHRQTVLCHKSTA